MLRNEGGRAALALTVRVEGLTRGAVHCDVVGSKDDITIPLTGLTSDEITAKFKFCDVGRHSTRATRIVRRGDGSNFELFDGKDRTKGILVTKRFHIGASADRSRGI